MNQPVEATEASHDIGDRRIDGVFVPDIQLHAVAASTRRGNFCRGLRERLNAFDYPGNSTIRENIAAGYSTPASVVQGWINSPGHYANILAPEATAAGIALYEAPGTQFRFFWAMDFGSVIDTAPPSGGSPTPPTATPTPAPTAVPTATPTPQPPGSHARAFGSPRTDAAVHSTTRLTGDPTVVIVGDSPFPEPMTAIAPHPGPIPEPSRTPGCACALGAGSYTPTPPRGLGAARARAGFRPPAEQIRKQT